MKTTYVVQGTSSESNTLQVIKAGDLLNIRNLQNKNLIAGEIVGSTSSSSMMQANVQPYLVEDDGTVSLPVLGRMKLAGMTRLEAQKFLEKEYKKTLLVDPIITLSIVNLKVTVLGEFGSQGNYLLTKDQTNLVEIIGEAGGLSTKADKRHLKIIRGDLKNPEVILVNLENVNTLSDPRLILRNNDIVYAAPRGVFRSQENLNLANTFLQGGLVILNTFLLVYNLSK